MSNRAELMEDLNRAVQRNGNLTVIFTHFIAQKVGLSATEFEFCDMLQQYGPLPAGTLGKLCGLSSGGVTGLINRLEKAGFARRTIDPEDGRRVIVEAIINEDVRQKVIDAYGPMSQAFNELLTRYTDAELKVILDFSMRSGDMAETLRQDMIASS